MTRTSLGASVLATGLAVVLLASPGCHKPIEAPRVYEVKVGPGPCDLVPSTDLKLSQRDQDQVKWTASGTTQPLKIVFRQSMMPVSMKPFTNMVQMPDGDWVIGTTLTSGPVNPNLTIPANGLTYKYDQVLGTQTCDGRIIIQP